MLHIVCAFETNWKSSDIEAAMFKEMSVTYKHD